MKLQQLPALSKRIARAGFRRTTQLVRLLKPQEQTLLFVFGGRTSHWLGMGSTLYAHEPTFRASVQQSCQLINELCGLDILPNFLGTAESDFFTDDRKVMFGITTVQLALADLWRAKGIIPNATIGVSLGEISAVYAAGGISQPDAIRVCAGWALAGYEQINEYITLWVNTDIHRMHALCLKAPVLLSVVYELGPTHVLVFCRQADKDVAGTFLAEQGVQWEMPHDETIYPYHTAAFFRFRPFMAAYYRDVQSLPLQMDYYSSALACRIPKGSLVPAELWYALPCLPVLSYSVLQCVMAAKYDVMTHVGPHPFLLGRFQSQAFNVASQYQILDSMRCQTPELPLFRQTRRKLQLLTWPSVLERQLKRRSKTDEYNRFVQRLNLAAPEAATSAPDIYNYLRNYGPIHYLPIHQAWSVCDYAEVNHVLQHPELFSSENYKDFDAFLLGADPPNHTVIRSLLMPLFGPQSLADLSAYTQQELVDRLQKLASLPQFDVAGELTIPLVQSVMAYFLDLSPQADQNLRASLKTHLYSLECMDKLKTFFQTYLEQPSPGRIGQLLLNHVQAGQLPLEGAVSMMRTFWIAGTLTTSMLLTNLINTLVRQPQLADRLRSNLDLIPKFVEEGLRLEPSETTLWRTTTQATTLGGQPLPAGSLIMPSLLGANRDPLVFINPNEYDLNRPARRIMTFGGGVHHCIGAGIARSQAQVVVQAVLTALPNLRLAQPGPPQYYTPTSQRALINLWVSAL